MKTGKLAAISQRVVYVAAFAVFLICSGFIYLENLEAQKVLKATPAVYAGMLIGYFLAIVAANYFFASRGENWTNSTAELCLVGSAWLMVLASLGPYMFQIQTGVNPASWWPGSRDVPILGNRTVMFLFYIPAIIFFFVAVAKIRNHKDE